MGFFSNLSTDGLQEAEDRVGGFQPLASNIYDATVKMAFGGQSDRGSKSVTLILDVGGREVRETIYVTKATGENFYIDKNDGKTKHVMPGYALVDELAMFACEKNLPDLESEPKIAKVWSKAEKKEINTEVPAFTELHGASVKVAILREIQDVNHLDPSGSGKYVPSGKTRSVNVISKFMHPETGRTINEYKHGIENPVFMTEWLKVNEGKDRDQSTKTGGSGPGAAGTGRPDAAGVAPQAKPSASLFGKK